MGTFMWCENAVADTGNTIAQDIIMQVNDPMLKDPSKGVKLFEGDIVLTPKLNQSLDNILAGKDGKAQVNTWPGARVPYMFKSTLSKGNRGAVVRAIKEFKEKTCIRFVPRKPSDRSYVEFFPGS